MGKAVNLLRWYVFCRVIDNLGDIGVCWRLCADLAARGHSVRLWVDDASALHWMAPGALEGSWPGVTVNSWADSTRPEYLAQLPAADVWVEGFGCEIAPEFIAAYAISTRASGLKISKLPSKTSSKPPVWINLEYLSAEGYVERVHGLPSPVMAGPAKAWIKHFYYPGFSAATGGLLREAHLAARQDAFDRLRWLAGLGIAPVEGARLVSLFCYEPDRLPTLLLQLARHSQPSYLLVTSGRATTATQLAIEHLNQSQPAWNMRNALSISYLPALTQIDFDHLLWACNLNFVRGEDSLVRALWAGKPLVWQIYPQSDAAHHAKLNAFLDMLGADPTLRAWHLAWNGIGAVTARAEVPTSNLEIWQKNIAQVRARLLQLPDLTAGLVDFALKTR